MPFPLSQLLVGAANARNAYSGAQRDAQAQSRDADLKNALAMLQMKRQQQQDDLAKALQAAQVGHLGAQTTALLAPPKPTRDPVADHAKNRQFDIDHPLSSASTQQPDLAARLQKRIGEIRTADPTITLEKANERARLEFGQTMPIPPQVPLVEIADPSDPNRGKLVKRTDAEGANTKEATALGGGKPTEAQDKSYLFYNLMKDAEPKVTAAMGSGKVRKAAITAYMESSALPGGSAAQAAGNMLLNAEEQSLIRSFRDFAAGVLRKESGAAVTPGELREVWGRYGPGFGDNPALDLEKSTARRAYMETMRNTAIPAIEYYQKRDEKQTGGGRGGGGGGNINLGGGNSLPPLPDDQRAKAASDPKFAAWLRAKGYQVP